MDISLLVKLIIGSTLIGEIFLLFLTLKEERSIKKLLFAIFLAGIIGWTAAIFINLWAHSETVEKFVFGFAAVFLTAQVLFAQLFPGNALPKRLHHYWSVFIGACFLVISFWDGAVFSSLTFDPRGYTVVENGFLSMHYALFALVFVATPIVFFIRTLKRTTDSSIRSQLIYLIIGFSIFLGVNILTNSLLPVFFHIFFFNTIGPVFSLVLAGVVFYIIWRYEFLDIHTLKNLLDQERIYARRLEDRVRERTEHIETMRVRERQLMQDIAHAQQTSLTILKTDVERLKQRVTNEQDKSVLETMEQGIDRSSSLMYDLLRAAHLETQTQTAFEPVDLSALVHRVAEYVHTICDANDVSLNSHIESDISLAGDAKQIEELLVILLSNAVKYRKPDVPGLITLTLTQKNSILLSVADNGIGIAKTHLPHLFERFYRVQTQESGNGLGLAIAHAIVQTHGGTISVESTESVGSTFTVRFPKQEISQT